MLIKKEVRSKPTVLESVFVAQTRKQKAIKLMCMVGAYLVS